jgi:uncharacterized protein YndB with AHSA1/START domain
MTRGGTTASNTTSDVSIKSGKIVVKRTISGTVDELFEAWLDPNSLAQWMRPGAIADSSVKVDARVGGTFEVIMHFDSGPRRHYGTYLAIERNRKLVFTWHSDATRHAQTLVTVEFNVRDQGTEVVVIHERMPDQEAGLQHINGWNRALALLGQQVTKGTSA